jgi:hypothetical protein
MLSNEIFNNIMKDLKKSNYNDYTHFNNNIFNNLSFEFKLSDSLKDSKKSSVFSLDSKEIINKYISIVTNDNYKIDIENETTCSLYLMKLSLDQFYKWTINNDSTKFQYCKEHDKLLENTNIQIEQYLMQNDYHGYYSKIKSLISTNKDQIQQLFNFYNKIDQDRQQTQLTLAKLEKISKPKDDKVTKVKDDKVIKPKAVKITKPKDDKVTKPKDDKVTKPKVVNVTKTTVNKVTKSKGDTVTVTKTVTKTKTKVDKVTKSKQSA